MTSPSEIKPPPRSRTKPTAAGLPQRLRLCATWLTLLHLTTTAIRAEDAHNWKLSIGGTRSFPQLREANADIHAVEAEIAQVAPGTKRFEDWGDVYTGSFDVSLGRRVILWRRAFWIEPTYSYARGAVETDQDGLPTAMGGLLAYRFRQEYELSRFEVGLTCDAVESEFVRLNVGIFPGLNVFRSDTDLNTDIGDGALTRTADGAFDDTAPSIGLGAALEFPLTRSLSLIGSTRYDWARLEGDADISDAQSVGGLASASTYKQHSVVDLSGYVYGAYLSVRF